MALDAELLTSPTSSRLPPAESASAEAVAEWTEDGAMLLDAEVVAEAIWRARTCSCGGILGDSRLDKWKRWQS